MGVFDQADVGCDYIHRCGDFAGDVLIAGLGVVTFMDDWPDDANAAGADQVGGTVLGKDGIEVVGDAVVLNYSAVAVAAPMQAFAFAVCGYLVAEKTGEDDAVSELAGRTEQYDLFVNGRRVPLAVGPGSWSDPGEPASSQRAGFDSGARGLHLDGVDGAEAD